MKAYLDRAQKHDVFMKEQIAEYEIGKRHLANIMGEDPESFSQGNIDDAIRYLLPSGLFEKKARPLLKHPEEIFPKKKAAQFGVDGRPFHSLFYTGKPNLYNIMHDAVQHLYELNSYEDTMIQQGWLQPPEHIKKVLLTGSDWISIDTLKDIVLEPLTPQLYDKFIIVMTRLAEHPYSEQKAEFIMKFRKKILQTTASVEKPPIQETESGRRYTEAKASRKDAKAIVKVYEDGTGKVTINGKSMLDYFKHEHHIEKEQIAYPLQFTDKLLSVDVEAQVEKGGLNGQAGAVRHGVAVALTSFLDEDMIERMRLAGLLTHDPRRRERKKAGQKKARKKFTWKKR
ncbi:small ribosomal subunit protein uS9m-like isoform X2 [Lineus longissimus]